MDSKKQAVSISKSLTGKKRKKKKKESTSKETEVSKKGIIEKESKQLEPSITIRKIETQCSSSSSIESQRPVMKLARIERAPSTSTKKQISVTVTNNTATMESRSSSNDSSISETMVGASTSSQLKSLSSEIPVVGKVKVRQDSLGSDLSLSSKESLRWFDKLSDEEEEKERIDEYKKNRRDRYKKELIAKNERKSTQYYYRSIPVK